MNIKRFLFPSSLVGAVLALILRAFARVFAKPASAKPVSNSSSYDAIDAYVEEQMHRLKMPGVSLAIVEGDRIVHLRGFGRARPGGEPPLPHTPFPIGSLTKSFTALAVMQLVEAGKIDLDAPVQRYLPWFRVADPQASAQMTMRHLLNQTSGLPTSSGEPCPADFDTSPGATERQARALSTLVLTRPVGSAFEYSNSNYNLLGLIIEAVSGELYADYVQDHIFTPLGMSHSYTTKAEAKQNGLAVGHQYWFGIPFAAPNMPLPHRGLAGGGLISCAEDMARYLIAHLNGGRYGDVQILSAAGIDELHRGVADFRAMGLSLGQYGMGWFVDKIGQTKLVFHGGTLPDFASHMALLPEHKKGVVLLFNACQHWMNPVLADLGNGVAALLAGEQPAHLPFFYVVPWALRGQLLIPALQIAGVAATLRLLRRWRLNPERRPSGGRKWGLHVLLPLIPNLLVALTLRPLLGKRRGYLMLYMPDYSWIAMICGSFSLVWSFLRTGLVLQALRRSS
ncbi:MAG TPA: serine hydrolase domain-containing protein [Anaerolineae bacterium]|nr:serine hydrolase domain-containing protein [Anaerolineae bacterium]